MTRERIFNAIAILIVAVAFIISLTRIAGRMARELDDSVVTIRFAHWQLEAGLREAFDEVSRQYMELHPNVRVVQVTIPERIFPSWLTTQLVGGTVPDLIELGIGLQQENLPRYFESLGHLVDQPNPYNKGTDLEAVPWRETFIDGLSGGWGYIEKLQDFYGVPVTMHTVRIFYNKPLFQEITGSAETPKNYEEFIALCEEVTSWAGKNNRTLLPIAGSRYNSPRVMETLFASQTQAVTAILDPHNTLNLPGWHVGIRFLNGDLTIDMPQIRAGLELMREVDQYMQPGYLQLGREDATFYFVQGRALMIATGSWDVTSLKIQSPFEIGVFVVPRPDPDHPRYGANVIGPPSEAAVATTGNFGLVRSSPNQKQAIDFLHFLTSKRVNGMFSQVSSWLPSVVGVEPAAPVKSFEPLMAGYVDGFQLRFGADTSRVFDNNLYRLSGPNGSVEAMLKALHGPMQAAVRSDLERNRKALVLNSIRTDSVIGALSYLKRARADDGAARRRERELMELQNNQESSALWIEAELRDEKK